MKLFGMYLYCTFDGINVLKLDCLETVTVGTARKKSGLSYLFSTVLISNINNVMWVLAFC